MSQRPTPIKSLVSHPRVMGVAMSLWPPLLGAGVRVRFHPGWWGVTVRLKRSRLTTNYVGTQFGGSLFAMTDPFWMVLVMRHLGSSYVVWDRAGEIEFLKPAYGEITARFELSPAVIDELIDAAAGGEKVLRWFDLDLTNRDGETVARVRKQLYVRRKPERAQKAGGD